MFGGGARRDQSLRKSALSREAARLVSSKEAASNLCANPENLDYQSTLPTSQGEGEGEGGGTHMRKSGKKRKQEPPASVPTGFFTVLST